MPVELRVDAGEQATFTYRFRPSERFEPRDFVLTVVVNLKGESARSDGVRVCVCVCVSVCVWKKRVEKQERCC